MIELPLNRSNDFRLAGAFALGVLCVSVIAGWFLRSLALVEVLPNSDPMPLAVAVGLLLVALRHWLPHQLLRMRTIGRAVSAVTGAIGIISLLQFAFDRNLGLDMESLHSWMADDGSVQGRVPLLAALGLTWAGLIGFFDKPRQLPGRARVMTALVLTLWATGLVAALLNWLDLTLIYGWPRYINTGLPTAVGLLLAAMLATMQRHRYDKLRLLNTAERRQRSLLLMCGAVTVIAMAAGLVGIASQQRALRQAVSASLLHTVEGRVMVFKAQSRAYPGAPLSDLVKSLPGLLSVDGFGRTGKASLCSINPDNDERLTCYPGAIERAADAVRAVVAGSSDSRSAMARGLAGERGVIELQNAAGQHVLAAYAPAGQDIGIVLEQETTELFVSVRHVLDTAMALFAGLVITMVLVFVVLTLRELARVSRLRSGRGREHRNSRQTEDVAHGKTGHTVIESTLDNPPTDGVAPARGREALGQ